jgi:integrase
MELSVVDQTQLTTDRKELIEKTIAYEQASLAENTRKTYASMWKKFSKWCSENQLVSCPTSSETVSLFLASLGGQVSFSTIDCTIAAIEKAHEKAGQKISGDQDLYRRVRKGIRREHSEKQAIRKAKALSLLELSIFCKGLMGDLRDTRDKAIITLAFFGALRRSELANLDIENIEFSEKGVILNLLKSKTSDVSVKVFLSKTKDQNICPVGALKDWISKSQILSGPLFRPIDRWDNLKPTRISGRLVARTMKRYFGNEYSGHSGRRGLVTSIAEKGLPLHNIQKLSRHKSLQVLMGYVETAQGFDQSSVNSLGI